MEINENIKTLCKARGISFADLADRLKITRQTLYRQSTGAAQLASVERIANALQVPAWIILHPRPLAALAAWNDAQKQGRTTGASAFIFCPHCQRPILIQAAPALATDEEKRPATDGPGPKNRKARNTGNNNERDPRTRRNSNQDKTPEE